MHKLNTIYYILVVVMLAMLPMTGAAQSNSTPSSKPTRTRVDKNKQNQSKEEKKNDKKDDKKDNNKKEDKKTEPAKPKQEVKQEAKPVKTEPAKPKAEETKTEPGKAEPVKADPPKPKPNPAETRNYDGIDVSKYQESIDWETIKKNPKVQYVYIKATEGCNHTDHRYEENIRNARKHGVKVGSYHFLTNKSSAVAQFENFRMTARKDEQDLIPFIDVEVCDKWTSQQLRDSLKVFADLVEDYYGVKPLIYTSENFFNHHLGKAFAEYPLFIAKYSNNQPNSNGVKWIIWQFSDRGRIAGIKGNVDLSCFNKGCSINDLLYKPGKAKPRGGNVNSSVDRKDKPAQVNMGTEQKPKEKPAPSKREQQEAKKKAEKEAKAKERSKKLQEEEAKKKAEAERKKAQEKARLEAAQKAKQDAEAKKAKEQKAKQDAEAQKAKQQQTKKQAAQTAKQQKAQKQAAQKQQQASKQASNIKTNKSPKLTESQRNDSIRAAQQQGRKINKSSADND